MKKITLLIVSIFVFANLFANSPMPTKIVLSVNKADNIIYHHKMEQTQTVYALAKFFQVPVNDIKSLNPTINFNNIKVNQSIQIPINKSHIVPSRRELEKKAYIPLYYKVQPSDNLYRISKVYFNQSVDNVKNLNQLRSNNLNVGELLLIGWYAYDNEFRGRILAVGESEDVTTEAHSNNTGIKIVPNGNQFNPVSRPSYVNENLSLDPFESANGMMSGSYAEKPAVYERKVAAQWNKTSQEGDNLYVLFSGAKVNSYVEIVNPMLNKQVIAKVIGSIPENTYTSDVQLIISPKVAKTLGAIDKKFLVKVKYIK